jgi:hypothetical protein
VKLREYHSVESLRRCIVVEYESVALTSYWRTDAGGDWISTALTGGDILTLPEIGIEIPVAEMFTGTDLANVAAAETSPG